MGAADISLSQGVVIAADIDTASDRVLFLQTIDRTMFAKARIKLNLRKLYTGAQLGSARHLPAPLAPCPADDACVA